MGLAWRIEFLVYDILYLIHLKPLVVNYKQKTDLFFDCAMVYDIAEFL